MCKVYTGSLSGDICAYQTELIENRILSYANLMSTEQILLPSLDDR